jgi:hypothetical protein
MNFIQSLLYQGYFYVNFEFDELEGNKNNNIQHKIIVTKLFLLLFQHAGKMSKLFLLLFQHAGKMSKLFLLLFQHAGKMSKKSKLIKKHERVGNLTFLIVKFSF